MTITFFCIHNLKILIFTDTREYFRNPDNYCAPSKWMSTTNIDDAKKECDSIPSCFMFFSYGKLNNGIYGHLFSCENTASVSHIKGGYILYQVWSGNQ